MKFIVYILLALIIITKPIYSQKKATTPKPTKKTVETKKSGNSKIKKDKKTKKKAVKKTKKKSSKKDKKSKEKDTKKDKSDKKDEKKKKKEIKEEEKKEKLYENEKKKVKWIMDTLDFGIQKNRLDAVNRMQLIKSEKLHGELYDKLVELIDTELDANVKKKAIYTAGELKVKRTIKVIIKQLNDDSEDVVIAAIYALKELEAKKESEDKLVAKLKKQELNENSNVTESLLNALGKFKSLKPLDFIIKQIEGDEEISRNTRQQFVLYLGKVESKKGEDVLIKIYTDEDEEKILRSYAVNSLSKIKSDKAKSEIRKTLKEIERFAFKKRKKYYNLYIYSVTALAKMGDKAALPRLYNSAKSNNSSVRLKAVKLLGEINTKKTIDILKYKMQYDPSKSVKREAEKILKDFGVDVDEIKNKDKKKDDKDKKTTDDKVKKDKKSKDKPDKTKKDDKKKTKNRDKKKTPKKEKKEKTKDKKAK